MSQAKDYIITAGKHIGKDCKKYVKGDTISLTDEAAKGMVNKIADPSSIGISTDVVALNAEIARLKCRVEELEQELEDIKAGLEEE